MSTSTTSTTRTADLPVQEADTLPLNTTSVKVCDDPQILRDAYVAANAVLARPSVKDANKIKPLITKRLKELGFKPSTTPYELTVGSITVSGGNPVQEVSLDMIKKLYPEILKDKRVWVTTKTPVSITIA